MIFKLEFKYKDFLLTDGYTLTCCRYTTKFQRLSLIILFLEREILYLEKGITLTGAATSLVRAPLDGDLGLVRAPLDGVTFTR